VNPASSEMYERYIRDETCGAAIVNAVCIYVRGFEYPYDVRVRPHGMPM
jgi:hypothetical protein